MGCIEEPPEKVIQRYDAFGGDITIIREETTQIKGPDKYCLGTYLIIRVNCSGNYLFEGWVANYRAQDSLGEKWEYLVKEIPFERKIDLKSLIYRLEIIRVVKDNEIERETLKFEHHGMVGAFNVQGSPMAK